MTTKLKAHVDLGVEPHVLGLIVGHKNVIAQSEVLFLKEKIFECSVALVGSTSCPLIRTLLNTSGSGVKEVFLKKAASLFILQFDRHRISAAGWLGLRLRSVSDWVVTAESALD